MRAFNLYDIRMKKKDKSFVIFTNKMNHIIRIINVSMIYTHNN